MPLVYVKTDKHLIDVYKIIRSYIEHEDGLIDRRSTWNILIQSFLLLSFSSLVAKWIDINSLNPTPNQLLKINEMIFLVISVIGVTGIAVNFLTVWGIWAAGEAIRNLEIKWNFVYKTYAHSRSVTYSHSHRRFNEINTYTLPVTFVTGGHKPVAKKKEIDFKVYKNLEFLKTNEEKLPVVYPIFNSAVAGRILPLSIPLFLGGVWFAILGYMSIFKL